MSSWPMTWTISGHGDTYCPDGVDSALGPSNVALWGRRSDRAPSPEALAPSSPVSAKCSRHQHVDSDRVNGAIYSWSQGLWHPRRLQLRTRPTRLRPASERMTRAICSQSESMTRAIWPFVPAAS